MNDKNMRPQYHEDQKPTKERPGFEKNETPGEPAAPVADYGSLRKEDERMHEKNNDRLGEKNTDAVDETLGIP